MSHLLEKNCSLDCAPPMSKCAVDWCSVLLVYALACRRKEAGSNSAIESCRGTFFGHQPEHISRPLEAKKTLVDLEAKACSHSYGCLLWRTHYSTPSVVNCWSPKSPSVKNHQTGVHRRPPKSRLLGRSAGGHNRDFWHNIDPLSGPCMREFVPTGCARIPWCTNQTRGVWPLIPWCIDQAPHAPL